MLYMLVIFPPDI